MKTRLKPGALYARILKAVISSGERGMTAVEIGAAVSRKPNALYKTLVKGVESNDLAKNGPRYFRTIGKTDQPDHDEAPIPKRYSSAVKEAIQEMQAQQMKVIDDMIMTTEFQVTQLQLEARKLHELRDKLKALNPPHGS